MNILHVRPFVLCLALVAPGVAQDQPKTPPKNQPQGQTPAAPAATFEQVSAAMNKQLADSVTELARLREKVAAEKIPMSQDLRELEDLYQNVRADMQRAKLALDTRTLDLDNLRGDITKLEQQSAYLSNLLTEYSRNFEARLHIVELRRYREALDTARLARENSQLSEEQVFAAEAALVEASFGRLEDVLGGSRFEGKAVDPTGLVKPGAFVLVGPAAVFLAADGDIVGPADQRLGSLEPAVTPYTVPADKDAAAQLVLGTGGALPFDPTLGNAQKVAAIEETWVAHILKGGPVMWPIFAVAIAALLVALLKWLTMAFIRRPPGKLVIQLLESVQANDKQSAIEQAAAIGGPAGEMLRAGAEHLGEPRELVEEVMFEEVLSTRLRLQSWLPFIAICATSAPLLGLLGTVTGIMNTFNLMTVFGTGDPKTLSSGISEALITTEYGLYVAIPALMLHAFLSRRARGIVDEMERVAVAFLNQVRKTEAVPGALAS